jgi:hypothetical protein
MLSRSLSRLPWSPVQDKLHQCETLSLVLLSRYANGTIPARVYESFVRSWGMSYLLRFPAVDGGRPGYVIAMWPDDGLNRITIAIEGMRTPNQLRTAFGGFNSAVFAPNPGRVYEAFLTHANTIYAELLAHTSFMSVFNRNNISVCFAGFSLGAAVAEVLSQKFLNIHGPKRYQLSKWASPRVGNAAWASQENLIFDRCNFYTLNDPIHLFPYVTLANISTRAFDWAPTHTNYAQNSPRLTLDLSGRADLTPQDDGSLAYTRACIAAQGAMTPANVWYWHKSDAYRLTMFNSLNGPGVANAEGTLRFQTLEFDDDNGWQFNYQDGQQDYAGLTQIYDPPPADRVVPSQPEIEAHRMDAARSHTIPQTPRAGAGDNFNGTPVPRGLWVPRRVRDL